MPPLDAAALDRLALRYVERFATTRGRLARYLERKVRERGWHGAPVDPISVAERMARLGYVDDLAFGAARVAAMERRGLGRRRVIGALRHDGLSAEDLGKVAPEDDGGLDAALAFARRRRLGPYDPEPADRDRQRRQIAALLRAGHTFDIARRVMAMTPDDLADIA